MDFFFIVGIVPTALLEFPFLGRMLCLIVVTHFLGLCQKNLAFASVVTIVGSMELAVTFSVTFAIPTVVFVVFLIASSRGVCLLFSSV